MSAGIPTLGILLYIEIYISRWFVTIDKFAGMMQLFVSMHAS
jgi:hypothetical protein